MPRHLALLVVAVLVSVGAALYVPDALPLGGISRDGAIEETCHGCRPSGLGAELRFCWGYPPHNYTSLKDIDKPRPAPSVRADHCPPPEGWYWIVDLGQGRFAAVNVHDHKVWDVGVPAR